MSWSGGGVEARGLDRPGRDRVTTPVRNNVVVGTVSAATLYAVVRAFLDWRANPADQNALWNLFQTAGPIVVPLVGALWGAIRGSAEAKRKVTPVDDPYLWDPNSSSWQPAEVMRRGSSGNVSEPPKRTSRRPR